MDVHQFNYLAAQPSAALKPRATFCGISKRALALLLVNALFWQPIWAQAEGIAVSAGNGATLGQAGNGVPIVNIAAPGANGLSHNQFQDYNVGSNGVILNNVTDRTAATQLGGIIMGNPQLQGRAAGVILNEVVGGSPSQLKGYTEVAGQAARVIVANPYGVTCNGCGFLNTPRVTLTTGKPILDGNRLDHFQVDGGSINIEGSGLNADNVDQFDLVTRSAKINAELHARQLTVVAGRNDVAADSLDATPRPASPGDAPQLAIDSSALGGMYANTIRLVGTEAGVGVKLAGNLAASAGDIQLDANGQLTMAQAAASGNIVLRGQGLDAQGPVYAGGGVNAQSSGDLSIRQSVAARDAIALTATGQLTNAGIVEAGVNPDDSRNATGDVSLQGAQITNRGSVVASRTLTATTAGNLDNTGAALSAGSQVQLTASSIGNAQGRIQSRGGLGLQASTLGNTGGVVTSAGALQATLGQLANGAGEVSSQDRLILQAKDVDNRQGKLIGTTGLDLTLDGLNNQGGNVVSHGDLQARVSSALDNRQQGSLYSTGPATLTFGQLLNTQGVLSSDASLSLTGSLINNDGGRIGSQGNLVATLGSLEQVNGQFISQGQLGLIADQLSNTGNGLVAANGGLDVRVTNLDNQGGELSSQKGYVGLTGQQLLNSGGKVIAGSDLTIKTTTVDNSGQGILASGHSLYLNGGSLSNGAGGVLTSKGDLQTVLSGKLNNAGGQLLSEGVLNVTADSLDNRQGLISSANQQFLALNGAVQNDGGQLLTDGGFILSSASLANGSGLLSAKGNVSIATGWLSNGPAGRLLGSNGFTAKANILNNAGRLASTGDLQISTPQLTNSGELFSQAGVNLDLLQGTLVNAAGGLITAPGRLQLDNLGLLRNAGELSSSQSLTVVADSLDNGDGKLLSNGILTVRTAHALANAKGMLSAAGLDVQAESLANGNGTLVSRGDLKLSTTGLLDNSAGGLVSAGAVLNVQAPTVNNAGGSLLAKGKGELVASQIDNGNQGLINSQAELILTADRLSSDNGGEVSAKGDLQLNLGELSQRGGRLIGTGAVVVDLGNTGGSGLLDNSGGLITTTGVLSFAHLNQLTNVSGEISSSQNFELLTKALDNSRGKLISQGLLKVKVDQIVNQGGLVSGWKGLGVSGIALNNGQGGTLSSKNGDLSLTLDGALDNDNNGALVSQGQLNVTVDSLNNTGGVLSSGSAQVLAVKGSLVNGTGGLIDAGTTLDVNAAQFANTGGTAQAKQALNVTSDSLDNSSGTLSGQQTITLDLLKTLTNTGGAVLAQGDLLLKHATQVSNARGRLNSGGLLTLLADALDNSGGGTVAAQGALNIAVSGQVSNGQNGLLASQGAALTLTATSLDNAGGTLQSATDLKVTTRNVGNTGGKLIAQSGNLLITADSLSNQGGILTSFTGAVTAGISGLLSNGGTIQAQQLQLTANNLDNGNGKIAALAGTALLQAGNLSNLGGSLYGSDLLQIRGTTFTNAGQVSGGRLDFSLAGALTNTSGLIESAGTLNIAAANLDNRRGQLRALGTTGTTQLTLTGALDNTGGRLETANHDLQLAVGSLLNTDGVVRHVGSGAFGIGLPLLQNVGGRLESNGTLTLSGSSWTNSSVLQVANLNVNVDTLNQTASGQLLGGKIFNGSGGNWTNDGIIAANENLTLNLGGTYQGHGRVSSDLDLTFNAGQVLLSDANAKLAGGSGTTTFGIGGLLSNGGRITAAGNLSLKAGQIDNHGTLGASKDLIIETPSLTNDSGLIFSGGNTSLWVRDFTNRFADVYSLGNLTIAGDASGGLANSIINRSGNLTSDGDMVLKAASIQNIRDVLTVNDAGVYTAQITEKPCDTPGTGNLDCSGKQHHVWEILQRDKVEVTAATVASSITAGHDLTVKGGDLLNSSSTIAAGGAFTAQLNNLYNKGVETGDTQTTRIFVSERTRDASSWYSAATAFNDNYWYQSPGYKADDLSGLVPDMSHFIGMTEREVPELGTKTQLAGGDQRYAAIIQAGGAVNIQANNDIDNSVVRPGYTYVSGGRRTDTSAPGSSYATVVTLNAQLPPNLVQQQVNPTTLPGFALPGGQNGLFRLSGQGGSKAQVNVGTTVTPVAIDSHGVGPMVGAVATSNESGSSIGSGITPSVSVSGTTPTTTAGVSNVPTVNGRPMPHLYLVETNPALTDLKQFLSSDYLLGNLNYNPDDSWRRLGDGLYEQRLIQQAIVARTGQRFLAGMTSDETQFKYLMDNAIASKQALNLSVGVSLTAEQVAALTHDIVWMEDQVVNGQHVLVPVLYLAQANNRLAANGALIQGSDVTLIAGNDLNNAGTLRASNSLSATATNNLINSGLIQAGDRLSLTSTTGNITNRAGGIIAGRDVDLKARRGDILNERTVISHQSAAGDNSWRTDFADSAARIEAANDLMLHAGRDVNNIGGILSSGRDLIINAGRDASLVSAQVGTERSSGSRFSASSITQLGSTTLAGQNLAISAGRDVTAVASTLKATGNLDVRADRDLTLSSAANETHSYSTSKKVTSQEDHVSQQVTTITAGGNVSLQAKQGDLSLVSSKVEAGGEAYLYAGKDLNVLAAQDSDYSLYDMKKKGSFGAKKTQRDEVTDVRHVGSEITAGGDITLVSEGNQTYQAAKLNSGNDLTLDSGGDITFAAVKDLHQESHEKSSSNLAWVSAQGKGTTDETLRQSQLVAQGQLAIQAAGKIHIDVKEVNGQTVSQTVDAMVKADPSLAWIKQAETQGNIDWRQVKEIHDSFKYSHSGLGAGAQLVLAIVMAAFVGPAAMGALTAAGASTAVAAGGAAIASSAATTAASSLISNQGNLGGVLHDTFSDAALRGYAVSGLTAGLTTSVYDGWTGTETGTGSVANTGGNGSGILSNSGQVTGAPLNTWTGVGRFAANQALQNSTSAVLSKLLGQQGSLGDALRDGLANTFAAAGFNLVGNIGFENHYAPSSVQMVGLHALMGGLAAVAAGGDFKAGALAAGASEALVTILDSQFSSLDNAKRQNLLTMTSQLVGVAAAAAVDEGNGQALQTGASVAQSGVQYNYLTDHEMQTLSKDLQGCDTKGNCDTIFKKYYAQHEANEAELQMACSSGATPVCKQLALDIYNATYSYQQLGYGSELTGDASKILIAFRQLNLEAQNTASGLIALPSAEAFVEALGTDPHSATGQAIAAVFAGLIAGKALSSMKGMAGKKAADFEEAIAKLPAGERVAQIKVAAAGLAFDNNMKKDPKLSRMNGRDIYRGADGNFYALDTQHGRFEVLSKTGNHMGEVDFDFKVVKPADKSGRHNIKIK